MAPAVVEWDQLTNVERTCLGVAFARWHGSSSGSMPCTWPDGTAWYNDPLGPRFVEHIPAAEQRIMEEVRLKGDSWMRLFCCVRTTEIDHQIAQALKNSPGVRQMVLLGAGMDTRAWRLQWPPGFCVFEVDSQQVLDFKHKVLSSGGSSAGTEHTAGGLPATSCERRVPVAADASKPQELWSLLVAAGFVPDTPTLYVLEGFIGYLTKPDSNALLAHLFTHSAPGSRIIITAPPTPQEAARAASQPSDQAEATGAAEDGTPGGEGASAEAVQPYRPKLHHTTFEQPTDTLARLSAAGWCNTQLLSSEELGAKYHVERAQPLLLGSKP